MAVFHGLLYLGAELESVHPRHGHVAHNDIHGVVLEDLQRVFGTLRSEDVETLGEDGLEKFAELLVVVYA